MAQEKPLVATESARLFAILESAIPFIFFTEPFANPGDFRNARVEFFNRGLNANTGRMDSLVGIEHTAQSFLRKVFRHESDLESYFSALEKDGRVQEFEVALNDEFSRARWCQVSSRIIHLDSGGYHLQGFLVSLQKIKERGENFLEENKLLETILSGIGDAVCVYDRSGEILFQSPRHRELLPDPRPYMHLDETIHKEELSFVQEENNGGRRVLEIVSYPVKSEGGEWIGNINILSDRSSLQAEEKSAGEKIKSNPAREAALRGIIGETRPIKKVLDAVNKISRLDTVVFIQGETGTGKELVAKAIHKLSPRAGRPFVAINCGALTDTLLDSELFGHAKGAFTGADSETIGLFEEADGGTVFLDEIGEMALGTQVKLLRVLQDGAIRKLGNTKNKTVNIRLVTATHRNIEDLVEKGLFREDLFYRIHVFPIYMPTLQEREPDILLLANHFLQEFASIQGKKIKGISEQSAKVLQKHSWPGNVRELRNVVERATVLCDSDILRVEDLLLSFTKKPSFDKPIPLPAANPGCESGEDPQSILACLEKNHWNKTLTAKDLNISRATLWRKMKELSLDS